MRKVLVMIPVDAEDRANLERGISDCQFVYAKGEPTAEEILSANVIIGTPPLSILKDCKNLELLQLNSSGVGGYIEEGVLPETTVLTNATGAYGLAISEYMVGVAFMMVKKLHLYRDNQAKHQWNDEGDVKAIEDCTTLTVGLGSIGGNFARRMKAMGSAVIGVRRVAGGEPPLH
jgi:phosphoglycerate dehydrogenase-like enzyme